MLRLIVFALSGFLLVNARGPLRQQFPDVMPQMLQTGEDPGKPLFLTPYIEKGDIHTALKLSEVGPLPGFQGKSHSGFLTVDPKYDSNMFFWFFPTQDMKNAPVLLWLQGGPGGSSLFGLFNENGPVYVGDDMKLHPRKFAWSNKYSMLYIDNPVGTGFSFTHDDRGYSTNETMVAVNLYSALTQFFKLFAFLKRNEFYITGESYAGKYLPALSYYILKYGKPEEVRLKGVAIGDGFSDPEVMLGQYGDYLFQIGMFDENERAYTQQVAQKAQKLIQQKKYLEAFRLWDILLNGDVSSVPSYFFNATGCKDYYNFLRTVSPPEFGLYGKLLAQPSVRRSIHVGNLTYNDGYAVEKHLMNDIMQSVKPWLAEVMNNYKVMLYSGQLDIIVAAPLTEAMLQTVPWQYLEEYKKALKIVWKVNPSDTEVAGYVRQVHNFYQVIVRGGGHILPYDQPERSFDMIDRFINNRPFA